MTVLEVELAVLIVAVIVLAVVIFRAHKNLLGAVYERQKAMDGYVKAVTRDKLEVLRRADAAIAQAQVAREEAVAAARKLEQHLSHPTIRRLTDG